MFAIHTFSGRNGDDVSTVMVGDSPNPRSNLHIGSKKAALMLEILGDVKSAKAFLDMLHEVASK